MFSLGIGRENDDNQGFGPIKSSEEHLRVETRINTNTKEVLE